MKYFIAVSFSVLFASIVLTAAIKPEDAVKLVTEALDKLSKEDLSAIYAYYKVANTKEAVAVIFKADEPDVKAVRNGEDNAVYKLIVNLVGEQPE